jgi:hypothetical protein
VKWWNFILKFREPILRDKMNQTVCKNFPFQNPFTGWCLPYYYYFCFHKVWWNLLFPSSPPLFHTVSNLNDGLKWQFTQIERLEDSIGLNKNLLENQSRYPRAIAHPSTVKVKLIAKLTFFQDWKLGTHFWQKLFKSVLTKGLS